MTSSIALDGQPHDTSLPSARLASSVLQAQVGRTNYDERWLSQHSLRIRGIHGQRLAWTSDNAESAAWFHAHRADDRGGHHWSPRDHRNTVLFQRPGPVPRRQGAG